MSHNQYYSHFKWFCNPMTIKINFVCKILVGEVIPILAHALRLTFAEKTLVVLMYFTIINYTHSQVGLYTQTRPWNIRKHVQPYSWTKFLFIYDQKDVLYIRTITAVTTCGQLMRCEECYLISVFFTHKLCLNEGSKLYYDYNCLYKSVAVVS